MNLLKKFLVDGGGATAVEYGLIAALISVALVSGLGVFSNNLLGVFNTISSNIPGN